MRQQTGKVTAQLKLKTLNDNPYSKFKDFIRVIPMNSSYDKDKSEDESI